MARQRPRPASRASRCSFTKSSWFLTFGRVVYLRRIHADVADLLHAVGELHVDRVAVHDADHSTFDRLALGGRSQDAARAGLDDLRYNNPTRRETWRSRVT